MCIYLEEQIVLTDLPIVSRLLRIFRFMWCVDDDFAGLKTFYLEFPNRLSQTGSVIERIHLVAGGTPEE